MLVDLITDHVFPFPSKINYLFVLVFLCSPHPYIFFNYDRVSMTFMGFYIDKSGSLIDPATKKVIEPNIMPPKLRAGLQLQRVELDKDFDSLPRYI